MLRSRLAAAAILLLGTATTRAQAPAPTTPPPAAPARCGVFFWHDSPNDLATFAGLQQGLQQAGLAVTFVEHHAGGDEAKATAALAALREARPDLVFAMGTQSALLAQKALPDLPIVFAAVSDPVASGVVADWGASGRNLCGASNWIAPANVLAVFRLAVPGLKRLGMLRSAPSGVVSRAEAASLRAHLATLPATDRIELVEAEAKDAADLPRAARELRAQEVDALWIPIDLTVYQNVPKVLEGLGAARIPLLTTAAAGVPAGALVGAVPDYALHGRRTALLALAILRDHRAPGALPVDRMRGNLVVVNLAAARRRGIELPLSLLAVADQLLEPDLPNVPR